MGLVWAARHRPSSSRVAIKVLTSVAASNRALLRSFRSEIRACAGLNHPSIVQILDRGEVPASLEEATGGQIRARTPYFVMEYVAGGSLACIVEKCVPCFSRMRSCSVAPITSVPCP